MEAAVHNGEIQDCRGDNPQMFVSWSHRYEKTHCPPSQDAKIEQKQTGLDTQLRVLAIIDVLRETAAQRR